MGELRSSRDRFVSLQNQLNADRSGHATSAVEDVADNEALARINDERTAHPACILCGSVESRRTHARRQKTASLVRAEMEQTAKQDLLRNRMK